MATRTKSSFAAVRSFAAAAILGLAAAVTVTTAHAQALKTSEYQVLKTPHPVATGSKIEVIEFFYFGCPICYQFQPEFQHWTSTAPDYVQVRLIPVVGQENYDNFAKLYYTLDALKQDQRLHWPVYDNFHFDGVKLNEEKVMVDWVSHNGINRDQFIATYKSDAVKKGLAASDQAMKDYDVKAVPTVIIDGKYLTSGRLAGSTHRLAQVVDLLVKQARKERPN